MRIHSVFVALILLLSGCVSADFKAVDALKIGMTKSEARAEIESRGFTRREGEFTRSSLGWPETSKGYYDVEWRAGVAEKKGKIGIASAEAYPVSHGLLGYGWIYLFYDGDGRLVSFYRLQIN